MYSPAHKAMIVMQLLPPHNVSVTEMSAKEGIAERTLYIWKNQALAELAQKTKQTHAWTEQQKLDVIMATAKMDEKSLYDFCDQKGLTRSQVRAWRMSYLQSQMQQRAQTWQSGVPRDFGKPAKMSRTTAAWIAECEEE